VVKKINKYHKLVLPVQHPAAQSAETLCQHPHPSEVLVGSPTVSLCCDQYHDLSRAESEYHEVLAFHHQHNCTPSPQEPKGSRHLD